jgi:hypothetical protein
MIKSKLNHLFVSNANGFQCQILFWAKTELKGNLLSFVNARIVKVLLAMIVGDQWLQKKTQSAPGVDSEWKIFLKISINKKMLRKK